MNHLDGALNRKRTMDKSISRRLVAVATAAAALVAVGVATAPSYADDADPVPSITLTAADPAAVNGHVFKALEIASYNTDDISTNDDGNYNGVNVVTVDALKAATLDAAQKAAGDNADDVDSDNPVEWVAKNYLDSGSQSSPQWSGNLRNFVTALASEKDFTDALAASDAPELSATGADGSAVFSGLDDGLYVIVDQTGGSTYTQSIPILVGTKINGKDLANQTLGTVEVKNEKPTVTKTLVSPKPDQPFVGVGDDVHWQLGGSVPNTTGYSSYTYTFNDTLSEGLTYSGNDKLTVTVGTGDDAKTLKQGTDYTVTSKNNEDGSTTITIDLSPSITSQTPGAPITVDYHSTVNTDVDVIDDILNNSADLTYSDQPGDSTHHETTPKTEKHLFTYGFNVLKQDKSTGAALPGAQFSVKSGDTTLKFTSKGDGSYVLDNANGSETLTTGSKGDLSLGGLNAGTYQVTETKAPTGYEGTVLPSFTVTITGKDGANADTSTQLADGAPTYAFTGDTWNLSSFDGTTATVTVNNVTSLAQLPLTGGAGIVLFVAIAAVFGSVGGLILVKARRASRAA